LSATVLEAAPLVAGRTVVRAPGGAELHLLAAGATLPSRPLSNTVVECTPEGRAVRPYYGPITLARVCSACLRSTQPPPQAPPVTQGTLAFELAGPIFTRRPLPLEHRGRAIEWDEWKPSPWITHVDQTCGWCHDPGPRLMAAGRQPAQLCRYIAFRCGSCEETDVYEQVGPTELQVIAAFRGQGRKAKP
jgi:hypothetical protein